RRDRMAGRVAARRPLRAGCVLMDAPSDIELIKRGSDGLRGSLRESLADPVTGALRENDTQLIKFHGSYQQDDRDVREERRLARLEPAYSFMIRTRLPGGVATPAQWLILDSIAQRYAQRGLRITTRQTIQLHGVIKRELRATLLAIHQTLLDTIAACGDVNRNVVAAVNPLQSSLHALVHAQAAALSETLLPKTRAYHELWLDQERVAGGEDDPLYGEAYLPRKFKIGFAIPPRNDIDVFAQDLGFVAILENGQLWGYDVCAGGGMGMTHGDPGTCPRLAEVMGFVEPRQVEAAARAAIETQRDFGDRSNRKHARLKYTIGDRGIEWFKWEVERRAGFNSPNAAMASAGAGARMDVCTWVCAFLPAAFGIARGCRIEPVCAKLPLCCMNARRKHGFA